MSGSRSEVGARLGATATAGMERWRDRLALVTGASGGIGAAVARALVQQGLKVVGCARTVGNIEEVAAECKSAGYPGTLIPHRCDLSSEEDILSMFSAVRSQHSGVDICINNAGSARPDTLLSGSTSGWKDMFNVNVLGLSICAQEAYQSMKERKVDDEHIININSMYGHQVSPHSVIHFYSATKYAITALTEGLRQELREAQTHIRATVRARPSPAGDRVGAGPPHPARMLLGCTAWTLRGTVLCCCLHDPAQSLPMSAAGADRKGTQGGDLGRTRWLLDIG
ncbi:dehydrogenase/reductase SDR family member 11 isoform X3 [Mustela erminea]|uniref:dehydrogenase/reductase SDR family member 11 isoform X3 n=1 Tax=Mustela erminea TaxID=36723 RepID=UPI00138689CA|nr:dehydrogenase/reductase SDR family member 11 isoform X3 [Mustela erminea]